MTKDQAIAKFVETMSGKMDFITEQGKHLYEVCVVRNVYYACLDVIVAVFFVISTVIVYKIFNKNVAQLNEGKYYSCDDSDKIMFTVLKWACVSLLAFCAFGGFGCAVERIFFADLTVMADFISLFEVK